LTEPRIVTPQETPFGGKTFPAWKWESILGDHQWRPILAEAALWDHSTHILPLVKN